MPRTKTSALITTAEAARRLAVSQSWVQKRIASGELPCTRITDRLYMIDPRHLKGLAKSKRGRKPSDGKA
jgi:excisionase family DNA binding protein